jgi:hypothetical protein
VCQAMSNDCAFCLGRDAAQHGGSPDSNPFPRVDVRPGSDEWFESDYGLWLEGYSLGFHERARQSRRRSDDALAISTSSQPRTEAVSASS